MKEAERRGAIDELSAYKDALQWQLIDNARAKKRSLRDRLRGRRGEERPKLSIEDLKNLSHKLMEQLEERDERMKLKELEKRQLFDRIIRLETELSQYVEAEEKDTHAFEGIDGDDEVEELEGNGDVRLHE